MVEGGRGGGEEGGACVLLEQFGGRLKRRKRTKTVLHNTCVKTCTLYMYM